MVDYKLSGWRWNKPLKFAINPVGGPVSTLESMRSAIATIENILDTPLEMTYEYIFLIYEKILLHMDMTTIIS